MSNPSRPAPPRADHVGSLLRPADLYAEIERVYAPQHTALLAEEREQDLSHLHELEDAASAAPSSVSSTSAWRS